MNVLGEVVLGEYVEVNTEVTDVLLFIPARGPIEASQISFIHSETNATYSFYQACYILARDEVFNNEQFGWGTEAEHDAEVAEIGGSNIVNIYTPLKAYMNGSAAPSASKTLTAYIVMKAHLMDVPTVDGRDNINANTAEDFGPHQNHMRLYNFPTWVDGPTP